MNNGVTGLNEIRLEVTRYCNCRCYFCHNKNTFLKKERLGEKDLSTKKVKEIIDKVALSGVPRLRFTGGEPLVRPDILELIIYAKNKGLQVRLNTNGTLINQKVAKIIGDYVDVVLISMSTLDGKENDSIVKLDGGFKKKMQGVEYLKNTKTGLWACTVVSNNNIAKLEEMADFFYDNGFDYWFCLREMPILGSKNLYSPSFCKTLIQNLQKIKNKYKDFYKDGELLNNPFPFCAYDKSKSSLVCSGAIYGEGHSSLIIDPSGNILVDYCYDEKMGNIFNNSLEEIWNSKKVKDFRDLNLIPKECKSCSFKNKCKGGSRFASFVHSGSINAPDPLMKFEVN